MTPVMTLFRKWEVARDFADEHGISDDERAIRVDPLTALEDEMLATPATCPADFAAKLLAGTSEGQGGIPGEAPLFWAEARAMLDGTRADLGEKIDYLAIDAGRISHVLNAALDLEHGPQLSGMIGLCADLAERLAEAIDALPRR